MSSERIVNTLSSDALDGLERGLDTVGLRLVHHPLLRFETDEFSAALAGAVAILDRFNAVALTSPRGAALYGKAVREAGLASPPVWASGPATASEVEDLSPIHEPDSTAPDGAAAALGRMMLAHGVSGPVLFPCGEQHRDVLPEMLRTAGVEVNELVCYRAVLAPAAQLRSAAASGDVILVGSGRVAAALADVVPASERPMLVAIGPVTAEAAATAGWIPAAVADEPTTHSLLQALQGLLRPAHGAPQ